MPIFGIKGNQFTFDEKPVRILSGAIHYFRVMPEYWRDRLLKLKACGLNTVETYVPWNFHQPSPQTFYFEGLGDIEGFIRIAQELDLYVIVRPSPYICAEWEFGGLPAWLLAEPEMKLRCYNKPFLDRVDAYYDVLLPKLKPFLCTSGGPIIAMQIENEYGSYGNDKQYLAYLKNSMELRGMNVLLFTSDGPTDCMLQGGTLPEVFKTVNFGSRPEEAFEKLQFYQPDQPLMCMEFWNGWFDHWGGEHHTREAGDAADVLDRMLKMGASVNFYMFHGGTNFGFYSGANHHGTLTPDVTSYDYDAPLNEAGDPTEKFYAFRDVISKYVPQDHALLPEPINKKGYGKVKITEQVGLCDALESLTQPVQSVYPVPMEKLGQNYGFILYQTKIGGPREENPLILQEVHDRAYVFMEGQFKGVIERDTPRELEIGAIEGDVTLDILVENMGRINYGPQLTDHKGITDGVRLGNQFLFNWTIHTLPLDNLAKLKFSVGNTQDCPGFFQGSLNVDQVADTFLSMEGWGKGVVFLNGFNLGRYWKKGPQKTLYVPASLLKKGENQIIVFELEGMNTPEIEFVDTPILG